MSFKLKRDFSRKIDRPEECIDNLNEAFDSMSEFLTGEEGNRFKPFKNPDEFFEKDKAIAKWAIQPTPLAPVGNLVLEPGTLPQSQPQLQPQRPSLLSKFPQGYSIAIIISVAIVSLVFLMTKGTIAPNLALQYAGLAIVLGLLPFSGPLLDRILHMLSSHGIFEEDREESIGDLFEEAHGVYKRNVYFMKHESYEGRIVEDARINAVSDLLNLYRKIKSISESEWYQRKMRNDANVINLARGGQGTGSDFAG